MCSYTDNACDRASDMNASHNPRLPTFRLVAVSGFSYIDRAAARAEPLHDVLKRSAGSGSRRLPEPSLISGICTAGPAVRRRAQAGCARADSGRLWRRRPLRHPAGQGTLEGVCGGNRRPLQPGLDEGATLNIPHPSHAQRHLHSSLLHAPCCRALRPLHITAVEEGRLVCPFRHPL